MHHRQLGLAAPAHHGHDAIPDIEARGARARLGHLAGELQPGDVRRGAGRRRISTRALVQIGAVEPRGVDADQHLAGSRPGIGVLGDDHLAVADRDRTHGGRFWQGRPARAQTYAVVLIDANCGFRDLELGDMGSGRWAYLLSPRR